MLAIDSLEKFSLIASDDFYGCDQYEPVVQYLYILFYHKYESNDFHIVYLIVKKPPSLHLRCISASCGVKTSHLVDSSMTRSLKRVFVYIAISVRG